MWESVVTAWDSVAADTGTMLLWLAAVILTLVGIIGCIMPYPGHLFILLGCLAAAFAEGEPYPAWWVWGIVVLLGIIGFLADNFTTALSTQRFGGSRSAIVCSVIGLLIGGIFFFPFGLIIGPFFGAFIAELAFARKGVKQATCTGIGATMGIILGFVAKLLAAGAMLACFFILK